MPTLRDSSGTCIIIYTDGSGIDGNIGAAAYCLTTTNVQGQYLGKQSHYNVYAAELTAIHLALKMVDDVPQYTECMIYSDSQAAIKALSKPGQQQKMLHMWMTTTWWHHS